MCHLCDIKLHAINESLVAHAHQLVDALLAFLNPSSHRLGMLCGARPSTLSHNKRELTFGLLFLFAGSDQFAAQDASRSR